MTDSTSDLVVNRTNQAIFPFWNLIHEAELYMWSYVSTKTIKLNYFDWENNRLSSERKKPEFQTKASLGYLL